MSNENNDGQGSEKDSQPPAGSDPKNSNSSSDGNGSGQGESDTFPRSYVEQLREEAKQARLRAATADGLAKQLFEARVASLGKLQDPTDIPFDAELLEDATALAAAVDDLVARKPHLAVRRVAGDIGQGAGSGAAGEVSLSAMLRNRA